MNSPTLEFFRGIRVLESDRKLNDNLFDSVEVI